MRLLLELTELAYEAALEAELWPLVLSGCAEAFSSPAVILLGMERQSGRLCFEVSHGIADARRGEVLQALLGFVRSGDSLCNGSRVVLAYDSVSPAGADTRSAVPPTAPRRDSGYYMAALLDVGAGHSALAAAYREPTADAAAQRVWERFRSLAPHLERALQLSRRLASLDTHSAASHETIQRLPVGVFMLDASGEVQFVNQAAHELLDDRDGLQVVEGALRSEDPEADGRLRELIRGALAAEQAAGPPGGVMVVHRRPPRRPLSVVVAPVRTEQSLFFRDTRLLAVFVADPDRRHTPPKEFLQGIYGLTRTESRLAGMLVSGLTLDEAALQLGTRRGTARVHLERIFRKTGTNRQADLVRVLLTSPAALRAAPR